MAEPSRYDVDPKTAGLFYDILENKLGITDQETLEDTETILLSDAYSYFFDLLNRKELKFSLDLILEIHRYYLEPLYKWAGQLRIINISKDGTLFCPAINIKTSLKELDKVIKENIPTSKDSPETLAKKLAIIHNEYNAIHPFREGNGRTIRLFLDLLSGSVGYQPIEYEKISHDDYISACIAGMNGDYKQMVDLFQKNIKKN